jgi:hypothetical protein
MSEARKPDLAGQLRVLPQYNNLGTTRPFGPGEFVKNSDGSWSNEYSVTVEDPRQAGRFMVVPSLWLQNGKPTLFSEDQAAETAANSSLSFPTFGSEKKAEAYADMREGHWQQVPEGRSDLLSPLWTHNPAPHPDTDTMSEDRVERLSPEETARLRPSAPANGNVERLSRTPQQLFGGDKESGYIQESVGQLGQGIADIPAYATSVIGNFFRSILPGGQAAKKEARAEFTGQVGDIATAASGGLAGPLGIPHAAGAAAAVPRGLVAEPRVAQMPRPPLALPPPTLGVPPGPGIPTGPGRPVPPQGGIPFTPPPARGAIPGAPPGTVATPSPPPSASTIGGGRPPIPGVTGGVTGPSGGPGIAGAQPQVPLPRPGTEGRPAGARAVPPLVPHDAHLGEPSPLANAIATNNGNAVSQRFRRAITTGPPGRRSDPGMQQQDRLITTAVDTIIENKDSVQFRDPNDPAGKALLPAGQLPRNLSQFSQSIDWLKGQIFDLYDGMAKRAGDQGVRVSVEPTINRLQRFITGPEVRDIEPAVVRAAQEQIERFRQAGSYSPKEAQNIITSLNASLEREIRNPTNAVSHNKMNGEILATLRATLKASMNEAFKGPQYANLRARFGALESVEANVANAVRKDLSAKPGLAQQLIDPGAWAAGGLGVALGDWHTIAGAVTTRLSHEIYRYWHNPNQAVSAMFAARSRALAPPPLSEFSARATTGLSDLAQRRYDRTFAPYVGPAGP